MEETPMDTVRRMVEINLIMPIHISKLAISQFRRQKHGILINMGSIVSEVQFPFTNRSQDSHPKSYQARQLAGLILKIVEPPKYSIRIFPGGQAKKLSFLSNILPEKVKDLIIQSYLAKKSKA